MKNKVREERIVSNSYISYECFLELLNYNHKDLISIGVENIEVVISEEYGTQYIYLVGYRLETDEEYEKRTIREKKDKKNQLDGLKGSLKKLANTDPEEYAKIVKELVDEL